MIHLHRLNGHEVVINAELIETIEGNPDTVILLATNNRFVVKESVQEVIDRVLEYRKSINAGGTHIPEFLRAKAVAVVKGGQLT